MSKILGLDAYMKVVTAADLAHIQAVDELFSWTVGLIVILALVAWRECRRRP